MTIEQLLCPAVVTWERDFRKKLEESHITMTDDEIADEFDKWLAESEDIVNKSVSDNIEHINEVIKIGTEKAQAIMEKLYGDEDFDGDGGDDDGNNNDDEEEEPLSGAVEGDDNEIDPDEAEQQRSSLTGAIRLDNTKKSKYNVFIWINNYYQMVEEEKTFNMTHKNIMRKLDVTDVRDMTALFAFTNLPNLDLSSWNTGNVKKMEGMFYKSTFNNDSICHWDVSSCPDFKNMFLFCPFNQSLAAWTPAWVEQKIKNEDGTEEVKSVRADLPILGGTEDEAKAMAKNFVRSMVSKFREEDEEEGVEESKNTNINDNTMNHVVDFDTFVNEGKFRDFIDRGIEKVKNFFKSIPMKLGKLVAFFKDDGEVLPVVSAYTALNIAASGEIPGVTAYCDVQNEYLEGVGTEDNIVEDPEYYGIIDKDSVEYRNYETFKEMVNEHYKKYGNTGALLLNEDNYRRVGFSAEDGGVVSRDIDSSRLIKVLNRVINETPDAMGADDAYGAVLIWGAPGIGKSTIPKSVIRTWNKNKGDEFHRKALMVIQCGDLTIDGFSLPIPVTKSIEDYLEERPILKDKVEASGIAPDTYEKIKKNMHKVSAEAPKTWLPTYNINASPDEIKVLNDIANGYLEIKENAGNVEKIETTEGGILLFDEFFRANEEIFKIMMQIILNREYSGYRIGSKWGILCCSNRPNDDEEVRKGFEKTGPVVGNRFLGGTYNFIPSFDEWKRWAVKEGGFDNLTIEFLMMEKNPKGEYTNWHTIKPDEYTSRGRTLWPTPRTWSALMKNINNFMKSEGITSITDVPEEEIRFMADGLIGEDMSAKYANFLRTMAKSNLSVDVKKLLEDPNYVIPEKIQCSSVTKQVEGYIKTVYSPEELPDVKLLMNLFDKINKTYSSAKDNFTKVMHVNIIKFFKAGPKSPNAAALKDYVLAVDNRYDLDPADLR